MDVPESKGLNSHSPFLSSQKAGAARSRAGAGTGQHPASGGTSLVPSRGGKSRTQSTTFSAGLLPGL